MFISQLRQSLKLQIEWQSCKTSSKSNNSDKSDISELSHGFFFVSHDEDSGNQEDDTDRVLRVEGRVLEVELQREVQDHLEAPEHVGLARTHPSEDDI